LFLLIGSSALLAQNHTIVALSHSDHTAYELDPLSGKILHRFTAVDEPHEGIASADGSTFYAAVPNGPHVVILDAATFKEKGRAIEHVNGAVAVVVNPHLAVGRDGPTRS
jgi:hypothetical protein